MDAERWRLIDQLVQTSLELAPEERSAFLASHCPEETLRAEVQSLIAELYRCDSFLETPAIARIEGAGTRKETLAAPPAQVGPYRIVRALGAGGMGAVFLAERADDEYQHLVAVKLLYAGWASESLVRRFRVERQILANLDHPNIARLLDGGSSSDHRPYLVMEFVDGLAIDEHCDQQWLPVRERIELFCQVCSAVRHAHRNLVVHRDLKPGNILVTRDGTPKLLDFGIAKLLDSPAQPPMTDLTRTGMRPMSLAYASPEQIRGQAITTASDIYSLGVLLYRLLTGRLPKLFRDLDPEGVARELNQALTLPSAAVTAAEEAQFDARAYRLSDRRQLSRQLRGDLDNIVLKALAEEPDRRYGTVSELVADLRRSLAGEPVQARPQTVAYRASRFLRQHLAAAVVAVATITLGFGFTVSTVLQSRRTARERDKAQQVSKFMVDLFQGAAPGYERADEITARHILDRGVERIDYELKGQPDVQATMLHTVGRVYSNLGITDRSLEILERALQLREQTADTDDADLVAVLSDLGVAYLQRGNAGDFEDAEQALERALELGRRELGEEHIALADALLWRGHLARQLGNLEMAIELQQSALAMKESLLGPDDPQLVLPLTVLADSRADQSDLGGAQALYQRALSILEAQENPNRVDLATTLTSIGLLRWRFGDLENAAANIERAILIYDQTLDPYHPHIGSAVNNLGLVYQAAGNLADAEASYRRALDIKARHEPESGMSVASGLNNLASVLLERGELDDARELWMKVLEICHDIVGPDHRYSAHTLLWLARVDQYRGKYREAARTFDEALTILERALGADHIDVGKALAGMGALDADSGDLEAAEVDLNRALEILSAHLGEDNADLVPVLIDLGRVLTGNGRLPEAETQLARADALLDAAGAQEQRPRQVEQLARARTILGDLEQARGNHDAARSSWSEAVHLLEGTPEGSIGAHHREIRAIALIRLGRHAEARPLVEALAAGGWRSPAASGSGVPGLT